MVHRLMRLLGFRKGICKVFRRYVHAVSGKIITSDSQGIFRIGNFSLYAHILLSRRTCPVCCEILDPLGILRLEGGGIHK